MDLESEESCSTFSNTERVGSMSKENIHEVILSKYSLNQLKTFVLKNKKSNNYPVNIEESSKQTSWNLSQTEVLDSVQTHLNGAFGSKPYRAIVSGLAGSGKSKLIKEIKRIYENRGHSVFVCAPFGFAASAIGGCTLHNLLDIRYQKISNFEKLAKGLKRSPVLEDKFEKVRLIILDEFLTAGAAIFNYLSLFLKIALGNKDEFGGLDLILVGDYSQIPPPAQISLISEPSLFSNFIGTGLKLYRNIEKVFFLKESIRSATDERFSKLLLNFRKKSVTDDDIELLNSRRLSSLCVDEQLVFSSATHIYPRNLHCRAFNSQKVYEIGNEVIVVKPIRHPECNTYDEEECFPICVGSKIRLKRNFDLRGRICSGSIGIVEGILFEEEKDQPSVLLIRFENCCGTTIEGLVPIGRSQECVKDCKSNQSTKVSFFPIVLSYALSCHGCQGLTLEKAAVFFDYKEFFENSSYVSLSRVRRLEDLVVLDDKIVKARFKTFPFFRGFKQQIKEYKRLNILQAALPTFSEIEYASALEEC
jgi:ATP-dependent DNA helicase PIF1